MSKRILSMLAILALSACAPIDDSEASLDEDGDSSIVDEGDDGSLDSSQDAVTGTACSSMTTDAKAALVAINNIRTKMGMGAINCHNAIQKAANAHANYQSLNGPGHAEVQGKPGFTGASPWDRMKAAGWNDFFGGWEVICATCDGAQAVNVHMNSVYHRTRFVSYWTNSFGFGSKNSKFTTIDFAYGSSAPSPTSRAVWPTAGATGVPTTFDCTTEGPNPCDPGFTLVGSPISLTGASDLTITSTKLVKAGTTTALPHMVRDTSYDSRIPLEQVYMIPKSPLKSATKYTATVKGSLNNVSFTNTWSFTTK